MKVKIQGIYFDTKDIVSINGEIKVENETVTIPSVIHSGRMSLKGYYFEILLKYNVIHKMHIKSTREDILEQFPLHSTSDSTLREEYTKSLVEKMRDELIHYWEGGETISTISNGMKNKKIEIEKENN